MKNKKGFTLIELIAAIGLAAIIGTVLVSNIPNLNQGAKDSSKLALVKRMEDAAKRCSTLGASVKVGGKTCIESFTTTRGGSAPATSYIQSKTINRKSYIKVSTLVAFGLLKETDYKTLTDTYGVSDAEAVVTIKFTQAVTNGPKIRTCCFEKFHTRADDLYRDSTDTSDLCLEGF